MELKEIELEKIIVDKNTQPRAVIDEYIVDEYRLDMLNGDEFPPLMVFSENNHYYLADGWHRYFAAKELNKKTVQCAVKEGGLREAILYSCGANFDHGKRRSNGDKERAVKKLLGDPEWSAWADREIARQCRVTAPFVGKLRPSVNGLQIEERKATRNGTTYTMNTANIGKPTREEHFGIAPDGQRGMNFHDGNLKGGIAECSVCHNLYDGSKIKHCPYCAYTQQQRIDFLDGKEQSPTIEQKHDPLNYRLFTSPVNELSKHIDAGSVDAIITDPPYPKEYIHTYKELAEQASIILKPSGVLVALCGHNYIDVLISQMKEYLHYQWLGCYYMPTGNHASLPVYKVSVYWKPLLIFCNGDWTRKTFKDVFVNDEADKEFHEWGQGITGFKRLIESFTLPNETVLDPFVGGGTTAIAALESGRYFIGSDISSTEVEKTRGRLNE